MPLKIEKVLVCDAVDKACVDLLQENGINVSTKVIQTQTYTNTNARTPVHVCVSLSDKCANTHTHSLCSLALFLSLSLSLRLHTSLNCHSRSSARKWRWVRELDYITEHQNMYTCTRMQNRIIQTNWFENRYDVCECRSSSYGCCLLLFLTVSCEHVLSAYWLHEYKDIALATHSTHITGKQLVAKSTASLALLTFHCQSFQ